MPAGGLWHYRLSQQHLLPFSHRPQAQPLPMPNILDHVAQTPLLEGIQEWPRSCSREEWFRITRNIVAGVIADMAEDLNDAELSLVEEHFIAAGLL